MSETDIEYNLEVKSNIPEYDQDETFDESLDFSGCRTAVIFISSAIGAFMAALATAIYYYYQ